MSEKRTFSRPQVSIVTVTYNAVGNLERTLSSVVQQQYEPKEIIIVDGGSTDGTMDIIRRYGEKITKWVSEPDGGIYDAMNKGVSLSAGEWIIFMNAGDRFASCDVLERIFSRRQDDADIIYGDVVKDGHIKKAPQEYRLYHRMLFCHQSSLTRRSRLLSCPFDTSHRLSADFKFFIMQYRQHARFKYTGFPIADFDTTGISNSCRSAGLRDNIRVVGETVPMPQRLVFRLRLMVPYIMCRLRGK